MHKFPEIGTRLKRAQGHLIKDHIHHCMEETSDALPREIRDLIKEFQGVTKYL